jgi:hypothetical protein
MPKENNGVKNVRYVADCYGLSPTEQAGRTLVEQIDNGDTHIAELLGDILTSRSAPKDRARALCRLLAVHGVGTIVTGRIG